MEPLRKQRNPDLIMDPNILLSASISYDEMGKYERYTRMITSLIPLTKSLAQQKPDRHTKSLGSQTCLQNGLKKSTSALDLARFWVHPKPAIVAQHNCTHPWQLRFQIFNDGAG
ncbi:hypothetical protein V6N13_118341 [Hibiscus sabdariffa]